MENIDLGFSDLDSISMNLNDSSSSSVNFGPGVELLMNNTRKHETNKVNFDFNELDTLEKELNDLSSSSSSSYNTKTISGINDYASSLFGFANNNDSQEPNMDSDSNLGQATKETVGNNKTWDGFTKYNDIPTDAKRDNFNPSNLNDREKRRKKRLMIKKLEEWSEKGLIKNVSHFNVDSSFEEVEDEYESALEDKRKKDSIKLYGWWFMTFVNSIEYSNAAFNPFDLNLDGWGEQVSEDIESYEDIFNELHDKYKGGKLAPELSLLLRIGFSAAIVNFTNKALSTATPGFNDVIRQSPELMKMFTSATVNSMSQASPGFAFASNLVNNPDKINQSFGPPPPPIETKNSPPQPRSTMQFTQTPGNNRQDINAARGTMFRDSGVDVNNSYANVNRQERPIETPAQQPPSQTQYRPEMRGPQNTDIDNILSGLKTRTVNEPPQQQQQQQYQQHPNLSVQTVTEDDSMISISSLRDLQGTQMPKRQNRRKNKSDKNIISLDI